MGLKVAEVLLDNRDVWTQSSGLRPILVVCYTNHALDQFLEGILKFCPDGIVRVGSRCKNPQLEEFNLKRIRAVIRKEKRVNLSIKNSIRDCFREMCNLRETVEAVSAKLEATTKGIVSEKVLQFFMLGNQYESLKSGDVSVFMEAGKPGQTMMHWLTAGISTSSEDRSQGSYTHLAQEVTSQIVEGSGVLSDEGVDIRSLYTLHPKIRAKMYR